MKRLYLIFLFAAILISGFIIINKSLDSTMDYSTVDPSYKYQRPDIPKELGVFERSGLVEDYAVMPDNDASKRNLKLYNSRRAYSGAPPFIPHDVNSERSMGEKDCLKCHKNGGYVEKFKAYTPVVPHPEKINCRQCHVEQKTKTVFRETNWKKRKAEDYFYAALPGSPPIIPHQIQLRENCLACHSGPAAPKEIKVSHPERANCRQCHVQNIRTQKSIPNFYREPK